jgi:phage-related baseplate assembly protein
MATPPEFVKIDPAAIEAKLVARYEAQSGKTLYPAQIERLFIDQIAYAKTLILSAIQNAGEKLLVRFSDGPFLDYLGELVGTERLQAKPARHRQAFVLPAAQAGVVVINAGARVTTADGRLAFYSESAVSIPAGQLEASTTVICETVGSVGNGWSLGQVSVFVAPPVDGMTTRNTTVPSGGEEIEEDERYKERIILAPEAYTNAGSRGAYRYHAMSAHQSIIDVAVHGPDEGQPDGHVALYPLTATGTPSAELLQLVSDQTSGEKRRPLCDVVQALPPVEVPFVIKARLVFYSNADRETAMAAAKTAVEKLVSNLRAGLGRDIVPEQISNALQVAGVYRPLVDEPAEVVEVSGNEWASCTDIELLDAGQANG